MSIFNNQLFANLQAESRIKLDILLHVIPVGIIVSCYNIKTSPLICFANQRTGFYMIETSIMKELSFYMSFTPTFRIFINFCIKMKEIITAVNVIVTVKKWLITKVRRK